MLGHPPASPDCHDGATARARQKCLWPALQTVRQEWSEYGGTGVSTLCFPRFLPLPLTVTSLTGLQLQDTECPGEAGPQRTQ